MNKYIILALLFVGCFSYSCKDTYDEHYKNEDRSLSDKTLMELIVENDQLSVFSKLIEIAAYDTLLSSNQTFTVWAPLNESLSDIQLESISKEDAQQIVSNHVARFNNSTVTPDTRMIRMRANKTYSFSRGGAYFGESKIAEGDILAKNGILHTIETRIPYYYNIYEYILSNPNTSKLADFFRSLEEEIFNEELSVPIDLNENGQTVYDTVTTFYNRLFDAKYSFGMIDLGLGQIYQEDSLYTMLVPTNDAWDAAYARISPYFQSIGGQTYVDSLRNLQTSLAILEDLIYRGRIENPTSNDLVSTSPSYIYNTVELFSGTEKIQASNGLIFQANDLRYDNTQTWHKWINVESDEAQGRVLSANTQITTRTVEGDLGVAVSGSSYLYVVGSTPSAQPGVTFEIPNVLSGRYDIYVDFIPLYLDPLGNEGEKTKFQFELAHIDLDGKEVKKHINSADLVSSDILRTELKIFSDYQFPVSNYYDRLWEGDYLDGLYTIEDRKFTTKLLVRTNVSNTELNSGAYARKFCIDRIIFVPVHE